MRKTKRTFSKLKFIPLISCCIVAVATVAMMSHAAFRTSVLPLSDTQNSSKTAEVASAQDSLEKTKSQKETTEVKTQTKTVEIDGGQWVVHDELPIRQPSLSPEDATDVSIVVEKSKHLLTLYNGDAVIAQYSVGLASRYTEGAKQQEGDKRNPEGEYEVCVLNDQSKFYLALGLNYPNANDAKRGLESGLITQAEYDDILSALGAGQIPNWYTKLGGQIMIHGQKGNLGGQTDWTTGCVAVNNQVMDILWKYCKVGTKVTILA